MYLAPPIHVYHAHPPYFTHVSHKEHTDATYTHAPHTQIHTHTHCSHHTSLYFLKTVSSELGTVSSPQVKDMEKSLKEKKQRNNNKQGRTLIPLDHRSTA